MFNLGLKLWSTNKNYIKDAQKLYDQGLYNYIELFTVPDSYRDYINIWKSLEIPYVIHAPHFFKGLNLAKRENLEKNIILAQQAFEFADNLNSNIVIFHPGVNGDIKETAYQINYLLDKNILDKDRTVIENKPYLALPSDINKNKTVFCVGSNPEEIKFVIDNTGIGFCFDIGHAIVAANYQKIDIWKYLDNFNKFNPKIYHLSDGNINGFYDEHLHLGAGTFDIKKNLNLINKNSFVSLETPKNFEGSLKDFVQDINYLKNIINNNSKNSLFKIVLASKKDIKDIFNLSNDLIVRKNSLNTELILWQDHVDWFNKKIKDKNTVFYVVKDLENNFMGQVRFDKNLNKNSEYIISLSLVEEARGKGLSPLIIKKSSEKLHKQLGINNIIAYIKKDNFISLKTFSKNKYEVIGTEIVNNLEVMKLELKKDLA